MSDTERKRYIYFQNTLVEYVAEAVIFGKKYIDIKMANGMRKTVPATMCHTEKINTNK
jgi:hypothetical protein